VPEGKGLNTGKPQKLLKVGRGKSSLESRRGGRKSGGPEERKTPKTKNTRAKREREKNSAPEKALLSQKTRLKEDSFRDLRW